MWQSISLLIFYNIALCQQAEQYEIIWSIQSELCNYLESTAHTTFILHECDSIHANSSVIPRVRTLWVSHVVAIVGCHVHVMACKLNFIHVIVIPWPWWYKYYILLRYDHLLCEGRQTWDHHIILLQRGLLTLIVGLNYGQGWLTKKKWFWLQWSHFIPNNHFLSE